MPSATRIETLQGLFAAALLVSLAACGADVSVVGRAGAALAGVAAPPAGAAITPAAIDPAPASGSSSAVIASVDTDPGVTSDSCTPGLHCAP